MELFNEVSDFVVVYNLDVEAFRARCVATDGGVTKEALEAYERFRDEYNRWIFEFRALIDDARPEIKTKINDTALQTATALPGSFTS